MLKLKLKLIYDRQSVGQSVLVSGAHLGPVTNFYFAMKFPLDSCGLGVGVGVRLAADSQSTSLGIGPPFGTLDQILSCSSFV
jgi:hypothetical protein